MSDAEARIVEIEDLVGELETDLTDNDDPLATFRGLVAMKALVDRLAALVKETSASLGEAGLVKAEVSGVPYRLKQSTSYKWNMDELFPRLSAVAAESGKSEAEVLRAACSISSAKTTGLRDLGIDPEEYRTPQPGAWRLEGPRAAKSEDE